MGTTASSASLGTPLLSPEESQTASAAADDGAQGKMQQQQQQPLQQPRDEMSELMLRMRVYDDVAAARVLAAFTDRGVDEHNEAVHVTMLGNTVLMQTLIEKVTGKTTRSELMRERAAEILWYMSRCDVVGDYFASNSSVLASLLPSTEDLVVHELRAWHVLTMVSNCFLDERCAALFAQEPFLTFVSRALSRSHTLRVRKQACAAVWHACYSNIEARRAAFKHLSALADAAEDGLYDGAFAAAANIMADETRAVPSDVAQRLVTQVSVLLERPERNSNAVRCALTLLVGMRKAEKWCVNKLWEDERLVERIVAVACDADADDETAEAALLFIANAYAARRPAMRCVFANAAKLNALCFRKAADDGCIGWALWGVDDADAQMLAKLREIAETRIPLWNKCCHVLAMAWHGAELEPGDKDVTECITTCVKNAPLDFVSNRRIEAVACLVRSSPAYALALRALGVETAAVERVRKATLARDVDAAQAASDVLIAFDLEKYMWCPDVCWSFCQSDIALRPRATTQHVRRALFKPMYTPDAFESDVLERVLATGTPLLQHIRDVTLRREAWVALGGAVRAHALTRSEASKRAVEAAWEAAVDSY